MQWKCQEKGWQEADDSTGLFSYSVINYDIKYQAIWNKCEGSIGP